MNFENIRKKEQFFSIWEKRRNLAELDSKEVWIARAMEELTQYHSLWESGDVYEVLNFKGRMNPFFHVTVRAMILEQEATGDPPEVAEALAHMKKKGIGRSRAKDSIGVILADEMGEMIKNRSPLNRERYCSRVAGIMDA